MTTDHVKVGDQMRMSLALLEYIQAAPQHESQIVRLVEVRIEDDGTRTLIVEQVRSGNGK